ncbi:Hypothetical predicted protein [Cloeon dipterum]|nr:Hypothetical predicted protein [Cloeon dipterum]
METMLATKARQDFDQKLQATLNNHLASILKGKSKKFNEFFSEMLTKSRKEFDEMFKRTYGQIYENNKDVFYELFEALSLYFEKGKIRLDKSLDNFFNNLYQKMFLVLNSQYRFDDKYMACVSNQMNGLQPFGDSPIKLSLQVKRSFIATRAFGQALNIAEEVVTSMLNVPPPTVCSHALTKMSGCNVCQGRVNLKACPGLCGNVMKGCLAYHSELDTEWNSFVDAFGKITERLLGPFSIEAVVEPINIKISEAVMNFQETSAQVSEKVFGSCGKPRLGARSAQEINYETISFGSRSKARNQPKINQTPLEKLINETNAVVRATKNYWSLLPEKMCLDIEETVSSQQENNCWNGKSRNRYTEVVVAGTGIAAQADNPEVKVTPAESSRQTGKLSEQMYKLRMLVSKLRNAQNGQDIDWNDDESDDEDNVDNVYRGDGSGSGDGDISSGISQHPHGPIDQEGSGGDDDEDISRGHQFTKSPTMHQPVPTGRSPTSSAAPPTAAATKASVTKAVVTYLFPIVVVWLGGMFSDW